MPRRKFTPGGHRDGFPSSSDGSSPNLRGISCAGCSAREEQLVFLREQVRTLQDKLLCLVPEAADRDHRLRLTQMANMRPEALNGIVPLSETVQETEEQALDNWLNEVSGQGKRR